MTVDPRAALDRFVAALEAHYHAVATRRSEDDTAVDDAYDVLADAFEAYDDALATVHNEATPFYLVEDEDEEVVDDDVVGGDTGDYDADVDDDELDRLSGDVGSSR
jgi:hypothetical protein